MACAPGLIRSMIRMIVGATASFTGAFLAAGVVLVIGIVAYVFILGRLAPITDPPAR